MSHEPVWVDVATVRFAFPAKAFVIPATLISRETFLNEKPQRLAAEAMVIVEQKTGLTDLIARSVSWDYMLDSVVLTALHHSFDPVPEAQCLPREWISR